MKKLINKNVIKAMTIGISALMVANSMNLTAFAGTEDPAIPQGGEDPKEDNNNGIGTQSQLSLDLETLGTEATEVKGTEGTENQNTVVEATGLAEDLVDYVQAVDENGNPRVDENGSPVYKDFATEGIAGATTQIKNELDNGGTNGKVDAVELIDDVKSGIDEMKQPAEDINTNVQKLEANLNEANKAVNGDDENVKGVNSDLDDAGKALGEGDASVTALVDDSYDVVDGAQGKIDASTTVDEAQGVLDDAEQAAKDSDDGVKDSREKYDAAKKSYDEKKDQYEKALENLEAAKTALYGEIEVDENGDPVVDENGDPVYKTVGSVDKFFALKGQAVSDATEAENELQRLSDEVDALKYEVDEAKAAVDGSAYGLIAALEKQLQEDVANPNVKVDYLRYREVAVCIIENYYVPDVLEGEFLSVDWLDVDTTNHRIYNKKDKSQSFAYDPKNIDPNSKKYVYEDENGNIIGEESVGDALKFGILKYKDSEGNIQTKYINWKTDNENKYGTKGSGVVIFEKTAHESLDGMDIDSAVFSTIKEAVDENGYYVDETGKVYGKVDGKYVRFADASATDSDADILKDDEFDPTNDSLALDEDKDDVTIGQSRVNYVVDEDGTVKKQIIADVTVTTYTGTRLDVADGTGSIDAQANTVFTTNTDAEDAYIAAFSAKIRTLADDQYIEIGNKTFNKADLEANKYSRADLLTGYDEDKSDPNVVTTGYKFTGTYEDKFTKNVPISGTAKTIEKAGEAYQGKIDKAIYDYTYADEFLHHQQTYEYVGETHEEMSTTPNWGKEKDHWEGGPISGHWVYKDVIKNYTYNGSVDVEYQVLKNSSLDGYFAVFNDIKDFFTGSDTEQLTEDSLRAKMAEKGQRLVYLDGYDITKGLFGIGEATIYYVDVKTAEEATINLSDDITNLEEARAAYITSLGDAVCNVRVNTPEAVTETTYTYGYKNVDYNIKKITVVNTVKETDTETYKNTVLSETVYNQIAAKEITEYLNDMWFNGPEQGDGTSNGRIFLVEYDRNGEADDTYRTNGTMVTNKDVTVDDSLNNDFRSKVDEAGRLVDTYVELSGKAQKAKSELDAAKGKVTDLKNQIQALNAELKNLLPDQFAELLEAPELADIADVPSDELTREHFDAVKEYIEGKTGELKEKIKEADQELSKAEATLKAAEDKNTEIQNMLADLRIRFADKVAELTAPTDEGGADEGGADEGGADEGGAAVGDAGAPIGGAVVGGGAGAPIGGAPAVVDGDGGAAVDDGGAPVITEEIGDEAAALAETIPTDDKKIYDIINDPTALAELIEEPGVHIGWWWWLLIIVALGATGWALYRKYKKNKAAEANGGKKDQK